MSLVHKPVLYKEIIHALRPKSGGRYVDGTLGAGGHAAGILDASEPEGQLLGLDLDPQALAIARQTLAPFGERAHLKQADYTRVQDFLADLGWDKVDGFLLDLGASSMQFDTPERGFSFLEEGPLDMRFDPNQMLTADRIVNEWSEQEIAHLIYHYGEDHASRRIARAIVASRPVKGTRMLAAIVAKVQPRRGRTHPATKTFQALRIAVNGELDNIHSVLPRAIQVLRSGGRLAVISFHSLEDRLVKEYFHQEGRDCLCPPRQPMCTCGHKATIIEIIRRPITPSENERVENSRSRSAKLRIVEKR